VTSAGDDDRDDDAQLRQLRAVWVSMRDEEPSDRGLAALMAAAREKASELEHAAQPSWWQRVLASLRRPPVLALATVTVLLGGALIITQRRADMKADATATSETSADSNVVERSDRERAESVPGAQRAGAGSTAAAAGSAAPTAGPGAAPPAPAPVEPTLAKPTAEVTAVVTEKEPRRDPKATPKLKAPTTGSTPTAQPEFAVRPDDDAPAPAPAGAGEAGPRGGMAGSSPSLAIAQDEAPVLSDSVTSDPGTATRPKPKKPIARSAPPPIEGEDRQTTKDESAKVGGNTQPTLDQLVTQCAAAAARGDCAAVRVLAQRILTRSPAVYKSRVASDAAIKRCLPSTAPNSMQ